MKWFEIWIAAGSLIIFTCIVIMIVSFTMKILQGGMFYV